MVVPPDKPASTPVNESIVAKPVGLLLQVPPVVGVSDNAMLVVAHTAAGPVIGDGDGLTFIVSFMKQPVPKV